MSYRILLIGLAMLLVAVAGCHRTGNYKFDDPIYAAMPGILAADPEIGQKLAYNPDGTVNVRFDKGEMFLTLANGLDQGARMQIVSKAFVIFHDQYMNSPDVRKQDGTFKRAKIAMRGFVGDTELYVMEWKLTEARPIVISSREGNYM
jgi:hypothetical protein